jgi:hypothetical protein
MRMNAQTGQPTGTNCDSGLSVSITGASCFKCTKTDVSVGGYSSTSLTGAIDSCHGYVPLNGDGHVGE